LDLMASIFTLGTSITVAVISSILAVRLALRRFYSEKWWERKIAAYIAIIEALHYVREHADTNLDFELRDRKIPLEASKELTEKLQEAMRQLRKQRDTGSLVISEKAVAELNRLFKELEASTATTHWQEHLEIRLAAVDKCLPEFRRIALGDLKLK
jgi:hypothetical protein